MTLDEQYRSDGLGSRRRGLHGRDRL